MNLSPSPKRTNHPPEIRPFFRAYWGAPYLDGPQCLVEYGPSNRPFLSDEVAKALCPIARELQRRGQEVQIALSRSCFFFFFATFGENDFFHCSFIRWYTAYCKPRITQRFRETRIVSRETVTVGLHLVGENFYHHLCKMQVTTWYICIYFHSYPERTLWALLVSIGHIFMHGHGWPRCEWWFMRRPPGPNCVELENGDLQPWVSNVLTCHSLYSKLLQIIGCREGMLGNTFEDIWVSSSPSRTCLRCLLERSLTF